MDGSTINCGDWGNGRKDPVYWKVSRDFFLVRMLITGAFLPNPPPPPVDLLVVRLFNWSVVDV